MSSRRAQKNAQRKAKQLVRRESRVTVRAYCDLINRSPFCVRCRYAIRILLGKM